MVVWEIGGNWAWVWTLCSALVAYSMIIKILKDTGTNIYFIFTQMQQHSTRSCERKMEHSRPKNHMSGSGVGVGLEKIWWSRVVSGLNWPLTIHSNLTIDWFCKLLYIHIAVNFRIWNSSTFFSVDLQYVCRIFPVHDRHIGPIGLRYNMMYKKTDRVLNLEEF